MKVLSCVSNVLKIKYGEGFLPHTLVHERNFRAVTEKVFELQLSMREAPQVNQLRAEPEYPGHAMAPHTQRRSDNWGRWTGYHAMIEAN